MGVRTISKTIDLSQLPKESKYITEINDTGITIHPKVYSGSSSIERSSYIQLDGTGMELFNSSGISIAKYGEDIRLGNENEGKLLITAGGQGHTYEDAGTYIIDGSDNVVAQFASDGSQIGQTGKSHIKIDYHSLQMIDGDTNPHVFFHVSDLRDENNEYAYTDTFIGNGTTKRFTLAFSPKNRNVTVTVSDGSGGTASISETMSEWLWFETAPSDGATITVSYVTSSYFAKAYTLGMRKANSVIGPLSTCFGLNCTASESRSFAEGWSTEANGPGSHAEGYKAKANGNYSHAQGNETVANRAYQVAIGRFNEIDNNGLNTGTRGKYAFIIGNGTADDTRSNALTVDWDGNVWCAGGITATPTAITLTYSQCTTGSYTRCYRIGNMVFLSFNINVTTATASYDYITGLPPALGGGWATSSGFGSGAMTRWWITTSGTLRADGTPTAGWHNGNVAYICQ